MLDIIVCVKAVPDPKLAHAIRIDPVSRTLTRADVPLVMNPLDKNALEAALLLKERHGAHISAISMGPPQAGKVLKECLALGADHGLLLSDRAFAGADAYATAFTLAAAIKKLPRYDLILFGMASSDGSTECVGPEVAALLGLPVVTRVRELVEETGEWWTVKAGLDDGYRLVRVGLPAAFTVARELNTPRALTFSGIVRAGRQEISQWGLGDLGVPARSVGLAGSPTIVAGMATRDVTRRVELFAGTREQKAASLIQKLADAGVLP